MEGTLGEIRGFAANFAPRSWMFCQGQIMPISSNQALFAILGTTYGGDGRTTFGLPDLRGRMPIGTGTGLGLTPRRLGSRSGVEDVVLSVLQIPPHNHPGSFTPTGASVSMPAATTTANENSPENSVLAVPDGSPDIQIYSSGTPDTRMASAEVSVSGRIDIGFTGGHNPHTNMPPFLVINWIICVEGVFPSRS